MARKRRDEEGDSENDVEFDDLISGGPTEEDLAEARAAEEGRRKAEAEERAKLLALFEPKTAEEYFEEAKTRGFWVTSMMGVHDNDDHEKAWETFSAWINEQNRPLIDISADGCTLSITISAAPGFALDEMRIADFLSPATKITSRGSSAIWGDLKIEGLNYGLDPELFEATMISMAIKNGAAVAHFLGNQGVHYRVGFDTKMMGEVKRIFLRYPPESGIVEVAKVLARPLQIHYVKEWQKFVNYNNGVYVECSPTALIRKLLDENFNKWDGEGIHPKIIREFSTRATVAKGVAFLKDTKEVRVRDFDSDPNVLNVRNVRINPRTGEVSEFGPYPMSLTKLPVTWDPRAECPRIDEFFHQIVRPANVSTLYEIVGYALLRAYPIHAFFILYGSGGNGKGVFLNLIRTFVGNDNVSSRSLHDLVTDKFATADLFGKLVNISGEIPTGTYPPQKLQELSGGDLVTGQKKFGDSFQFVNHAKLIFAGNWTPKIRNLTPAFLQRYKLVEFPNVFRGTPQEDIDLLAKLTTPEELSGLLNKSLEGLRRVLSSSPPKFSGTFETEAEAKADWMTRTDPVARFISARVRIDPGLWVEKDRLLSAFGSWHETTGEAAVPPNKFFERLKVLIPSAKDYRPRVNGARTHALKGIGLKPE